MTESGTTGNRAAATEVLHENQQLMATSQGLEAAHTVDVTSHIAWQQGKLIANEMPLPEFVKELERYHKTRIIISNAEVAALKVGGVFELDRPESILRALALSHGLKVVQLNPQTIQLLKDSQ